PGPAPFARANRACSACYRTVCAPFRVSTPVAPCNFHDPGHNPRMNTTTDTPPAKLTTTQRRAALAWIERDGASLRQVAARLDLAADDLLDILTQPHVAAFIEAADTLIQIRTNILARYDDIDARQSLVAIAKDPEADNTIRLRAAITILQGPPPRRAALTTGTLTPGSPTVPAGPRP